VVRGSEAGTRFSARGLNRAVVEGSLLVTCRERRHPSVVVEVVGSEARFVKHAVDDLGRSALARERTTVAALTRDASLARLLPVVISSDGGTCDLTFRYEVGASDLRVLSLGDRGLPPEAGIRLGQSLRELHDAAHVVERTSTVDLRFHLPSTDNLQFLTPASISLMEILQRADGVASTLERLASDWRSDGLIHGDLRFDNVLVGVDPTRPIVVVDWEDAGLGDRAWDLGTVIGEILSTWLYTGGAALNTPWPRPPEPFRGWVRRFLEGYGAIDRSGEDLRRAVEYAGAWLIQVAVEHCLVSTAIPPAAILRLQLAQNIFTRPAAAADLIGIGR
jgi:hypothetical protein